MSQLPRLIPLLLLPFLLLLLLHALPSHGSLAPSPPVPSPRLRPAFPAPRPATPAVPSEADPWAARLLSAAIDPAIDCPLKAFAVQFASYLQPAAWPHSSNWTAEAFAALNLSALCGLSLADVAPPPFSRPSTLPASAVSSPPCQWQRYVDGVRGSDANDGSLASPWQALGHAVAQSRLRRTSLVAACLVVRGGTYYLGDQHQQAGRPYESQLGAIALTAQDSNLTIAAYPGEQVTLSGGVLLSLQWTVHQQSAVGAIMRATVPDGVLLGWDNFNELFVDGGRAVRAKYPNGDPFLTSRLTHPTGYVSGAASWIGPDRSMPAATEIHVSQPAPNSQYFPQFQLGLQGTVRDFDPPRSFWALTAPPGGAGATYVKPRGFRWNKDFSPRAANWSNPTTGRVFTFHGRGWGSWQWAIAAVDAANETVLFGAGGWQEARGAANGGLMYVHNILEELDDANEWFLDEASRTLYLMTDGSAPSSVVASQVPCVLSMQGSRQSPVSSVTIAGLSFAHTSNHFLRPYEAPSGGDYAIHRGGAVFLQGTEHVTVVNSSFAQLGGNALVVSNYNFNATVAHNEFRWLGESAVILVGQSDGVDGVSNRNQPTGSHVEGNLVHDFSVYVKQGDAIFESLCRSSVWAGNLAYNSPRSIFNKNDGFAGGLNAYQNLLFNANRETSDHGPINTWDREPYLTEEAGEGPSLVPKPNRIHHNFLVNDFGSDMCVDHDDGSAYYVDSYNLNLYSGTKNYLGHSKVNDHQLFVYSDLHPGYNFPGCQFDDTAGNYGSAWTNNKCLLKAQEVPYLISYCNAKNVSAVPLHAANAIYTPSGEPIFRCGHQNFTLAQWQALGLDNGSTQATTPDVATIIQWASQILFLPDGQSHGADELLQW